MRQGAGVEASEATEASPQFPKRATICLDHTNELDHRTPVSGERSKGNQRAPGHKALLPAVDEHPCCDNHQRAHDEHRIAKEQIKNHADSSEQRSVARLVAAII